MKRPLLALSLALNLVFACALYILLDRLGGARYVFFKATIAGPGTGVSVGRTEHFELLEDTENEIIFLGDSITQQAEWVELLVDFNVKNRGIGGNTAAQILSRAGEIASSRPEKVFLMVGINDLAVESKETVLKRIKAIVSYIRTESPETEVYLQSVLPVNNSIRRTGRHNSDIKYVNIKLEEYSLTESNVTWVDLATSFADSSGQLNPDYTHDGLHLNGKAFLKWREIILPHF